MFPGNVQAVGGAETGPSGAAAPKAVLQTRRASGADARESAGPGGLSGAGRRSSGTETARQWSGGPWRTSPAFVSNPAPCGGGPARCAACVRVRAVPLARPGKAFPWRALPAGWIAQHWTFPPATCGRAAARADRVGLEFPRDCSSSASGRRCHVRRGRAAGRLYVRLGAYHVRGVLVLPVVAGRAELAGPLPVSGRCGGRLRRDRSEKPVRVQPGLGSVRLPGLRRSVSTPGTLRAVRRERELSLPAGRCNELHGR